MAEASAVPPPQNKLGEVIKKEEKIEDRTQHQQEAIQQQAKK